MPLMDASTVQRTLKRLGYWEGALGGKLHEPSFVEALRRFQQDVGLDADGVYGPHTDAALTGYAARLASAPAALRSARRWRLTTYHVADESEYGGMRTVPVLDAAGNRLASVAPAMFANMALEGTGRLLDGRLLNVTGGWVAASAADYEPVLGVAAGYHWLPDRAAYAGIRLEGGAVVAALAFAEVPADKRGDGYGVAHKVPLAPLRTLAADVGRGARSERDRKIVGKAGALVPLGTRVWIAELVGDALPGGAAHDGWCTVNDTGGAIYGAHFDVFAGTALLARRAAVPRIGHIWFEGIEARVPATYGYGL